MFFLSEQRVHTRRATTSASAHDGPSSTHMWSDSTLLHHEVKDLPSDNRYRSALPLACKEVVESIVDLARIPRKGQPDTQHSDSALGFGSFGVGVSTVTHQKRVSKRKVRTAAQLSALFVMQHSFIQPGRVPDARDSLYCHTHPLHNVCLGHRRGCTSQAAQAGSVGRFAVPLSCHGITTCK